MRHLAVGERARFTIKARAKETSTGLLLCAGEQYLFDAQGKWRDLPFVCDANGWDSALYKRVNSKKRKPAFPWLSLIGYLRGHAASAFLIGSYREHTCSNEGELICYANDAESMYGNNFGSVELTVTRKA